MGMSIDEIIANETKLAQEFQEIIDTHMISDNFSLEEMYCDDTEVIEEHLQRCKVFADYHSTITNTLYKYQKIKEIVTDWKSDGGAFEMSESYWLRLISEVVEDGKIY